MYIRLRKARHRSRIICLLIFVGCPLLLYVLVGAYPINILSDKTKTSASPADVKRETNAREYATAKFQSLASTVWK